MRKKYNEFRLIQFTEKGKLITYMPEYPRSWDKGMYIHASFNVKLKDNRNWFQRTFLNRKWNKYWGNNLIASQVHKSI